MLTKNMKSTPTPARIPNPQSLCQNMNAQCWSSTDQIKTCACSQLILLFWIRKRLSGHKSTAYIENEVAHHMGHIYPTHWTVLEHVLSRCPKLQFVLGSHACIRLRVVDSSKDSQNPFGCSSSSSKPTAVLNFVSNLAILEVALESFSQWSQPQPVRVVLSIKRCEEWRKRVLP